MLAAYVLFLAGVLAAPQKSADLRSLYGEPELEGFAARPEVVLTVEHGSDGLACKMSIKPGQSLFIEEAPPGGLTPPNVMSQEGVTAIVDEVVPPSTRGRETPGPMNFQSSCLESELASYANVRIDRVTACNLGERGVESVDVTFEPGHCPTVAQKTSELRSRYGPPNTEDFLARPGITLVVLYGPDVGACNMWIDSHGNHLTIRTAMEILDEAIPSSAKGMLISPMMNTQAGCGGFGSARYENVTVSYSATLCPEHVNSATANFTRAACQNLPQ